MTTEPKDTINNEVATSYTYGKKHGVPAGFGPRMISALEEMWNIKVVGRMFCGDPIFRNRDFGAQEFFQLTDNGGEFNFWPINSRGVLDSVAYTAFGLPVNPVTMAYRLAKFMAGDPIDYDYTADEGDLELIRESRARGPL